jgi:predicted transcriptional regulator
MKLIESTIDNTKYPPQNVISLTNKGRKVAQKLKEIEEVLEE